MKYPEILYNGEAFVSQKAAELLKDTDFVETAVAKFGWVETPEHIIVYNKGNDKAVIPHKGPRLMPLGILDENDILLAKTYTQSSVQTWLREKHKLIVLVRMFDPDREDYFSYSLVKRSGNQINQFPYKSYEDALEEGLITALKYLKNRTKKVVVKLEKDELETLKSSKSLNNVANVTAYKIEVVEHDSWSGSKTKDWMVCMTENDAYVFEKEFNARNTEPYAPEWYEQVEGKPIAIQLTMQQFFKLKKEPKSRIWLSNL
jgi:hypothetical protein